jgi:hypothetical protein
MRAWEGNLIVVRKVWNLIGIASLAFCLQNASTRPQAMCDMQHRTGNGVCLRWTMEAVKKKDPALVNQVRFGLEIDLELSQWW